jgi:hypothetical protein
VGLVLRAVVGVELPGGLFLGKVAVQAEAPRVLARTQVVASAVVVVVLVPVCLLGRATTFAEGVVDAGSPHEHRSRAGNGGRFFR